MPIGEMREKGEEGAREKEGEEGGYRPLRRAQKRESGNPSGGKGSLFSLNGAREKKGKTRKAKIVE